MKIPIATRSKEAHLEGLSAFQRATRTAGWFLFFINFFALIGSKDVGANFWQGVFISISIFSSVVAAYFAVSILVSSKRRANHYRYVFAPFVYGAVVWGSVAALAMYSKTYW